MNIKRRIIKALYLLIKDPRLFFKILVIRFFYPILFRWFLPHSPVQRKIRGVLFEFDFSLDRFVKEMYFEFYEIEVVRVMKAVLKPGDIFIDVGASIGYFSCLGAGFVGKTGEVHSFESVPQYFQRLKRMAMMNPEYKITVNQYALGEKEEIKDISVSNIEDIGWNTMVSGFMEKETVKETLKSRFID